MELHTIKPKRGSVKRNTRKGRGQGSGQGGTSTRGHKGQKSRSGYSKKRNFEGGQMPLQMRLPKRGFKNYNRKVYAVMNLDQLQAIAEKFGLNEITVETLVGKRYLSKNDKIKILGRGELTSALVIEAHAVSASAKKAIEEAGGSITIV